MRRRLLNFAVAGSLVLLAVATFFWPRSYWHHDEIGYIAGDGEPFGDGVLFSVRSEHGGIGVGRCDMPAQVEIYGWRYYHGEAGAYNGIRIYGWEGDSDRLLAEGGGFLLHVTGGEWRAIVPYWAVVLVSALLPAWWGYRRLRPTPRGYDVLPAAPTDRALVCRSCVAEL